MVLTFAQKKPSSTTSKTGGGSDDIIKKIEASNNFSKLYSANRSPASDITENKIRSVVFKEGENSLDQTARYQFWKMNCGEPDYYVLTVSLKHRDLISIEDKYSYTIPTKFFKITDENEVDIIIYDSPRY